MSAINKLIIICSLTIFFVQGPLCRADEAHNKMVNGVIRKYLRNYKAKIVGAEKVITKKLNDVLYDVEHRFHHFVQNFSIQYDLDSDAVNDCIQSQVKEFGPNKLNSEKCHLIGDSHKIDYKYGNLVNFGNFTRAVKGHCKNLYNSNTKQAAVEKCVNEAGPPFIKKQKATVADVKKDGEKLVNQAKACSKNVKEMYQKAEKQIYQKCHNVR